jgi:hypothetical protein
VLLHRYLVAVSKTECVVARCALHIQPDCIIAARIYRAAACQIKGETKGRFKFPSHKLFIKKQVIKIGIDNQ